VGDELRRWLRLLLVRAVGSERREELQRDRSEQGVVDGGGAALVEDAEEREDLRDARLVDGVARTGGAERESDGGREKEGGNRRTAAAWRRKSSAMIRS
jgi:hypothetical protein